MKIRRIYVEKKREFAVQSRTLLSEIKEYLGIGSIDDVRILVRYDMENLSEETYQKALAGIFYEPPLDDFYEENFPKKEGDVYFFVEYLPGQFDQRADSAMQCVRLLDDNNDVRIRTAAAYVLTGSPTPEEVEKIKSYCINPVDSREAGETKPTSLISEIPVPEDVAILSGFCEMDRVRLFALYDSLMLAMTREDFVHIQTYFAQEEHRDPTITEIRVLDTYWSDHCRHTTFLTELTKIDFEEGAYRGTLQKTYEEYLADRDRVFGEESNRPITLMDLALIAMRRQKKDGRLTGVEESEEINACSILVPVTVDGQKEEWLVNFKNETHNHPTEIEPFGGAATCLGGAIRDPLSGRTYVYQAMRITGAADPRRPLAETLPGKLPQRKIVTTAAHGYSSYGNQIGLATGFVEEIYHPSYVAKRLEIGAVVGAAPKKDVVKCSAKPGDIVILLGGRTGRDGCGGATGSSKQHTTDSIETAGAEVQKGNAPTERKIQRLFRHPILSRMIKKCNDFGAGGVCVAIGELAPGLFIRLDEVEKKYEGLDGTEIAISESQERMAVVIAPENEELFLSYADRENLEAKKVASVESLPRLIMEWRGKRIVDISRAFLDTNGARQTASVIVSMPEKERSPFSESSTLPEGSRDTEKRWKNLLGDLSVCSQKGLVEMFDSSVGADTVLMPYGGIYQLTKTRAMVAKLPVLTGECNDVTMMSYGFDPLISAWSPFHGAVYAVVDSVARIVATGGDYHKIFFTFQEYFKRLGTDPKRWGEPFCALLGAYHAQQGLGLSAIGGKDSMSGSFNDLDVVPTLVSFALCMGDAGEVISPELKETGSLLVLFSVKKDEEALFDYDHLRSQYEAFYMNVAAGRILSAFSLGRHGVAEAAAKMAFGNGRGVSLNDRLSREEFFGIGYGSILAEVKKDCQEALVGEYRMVGSVQEKPFLEYAGVSLFLREALNLWSTPLESVFPTTTEEKPLSERLFSSKEPSVGKHASEDVFLTKTIYTPRRKSPRPNVFIPVMPGTNCEYDSARAFGLAGAETEIVVFRNLSPLAIAESVASYKEAIERAQILMLPGGFSAGDEPEGSAKFFATVFRNPAIREAVFRLIHERDGLVLGICNGFQALVKMGLLPDGVINAQTPDSPSLAMNHLGRHVSKMVTTKVVSNRSPWLMNTVPGEVYTIPASHGEGRFIASDNVLKKLFENGQVATRYTDAFGRPTMDDYWNINGSYMAVEGITSPDGRVFGKMAHSERIGSHVSKNISGKKDMGIFAAGVQYFQ